MATPYHKGLNLHLILTKAYCVPLELLLKLEYTQIVCTNIWAFWSLWGSIFPVHIYSAPLCFKAERTYHSFGSA